MNILTPAQLTARKRSGWKVFQPGYDMSYKSHWNEPWFFIREFFQNSCPYDMPLLILKDGKISLVEIGKFVEDRLQDERQGNCEDVVYALSFHSYRQRGYRLTWQKIEKVYRHPFQDDMVRVKLTNGLETRVTNGHSLFKRHMAYGKTTLYSLPTSDLSVGDYLAMPFANFHVSCENEFDVLKYLKDTSRVKVRGEAERCLQAGIPITKDERHLDSIPLSFIQAYNIPLPKYCLIDGDYGQNPISRTLPMGPLVFLMGLFLAEGSLMKHDGQKGKMICLSLGKHETELIQAVQDNANKLGIVSTVTHPHETAVNILLTSQILALLFEELFGGKRANEKFIPDLIFNLSEYYQKLFIKSYSDGDGYDHTKQHRNIIATASRKLKWGLQYLFVLNKIPFSLEVRPPEDRIVKGNEAHFGESYTFYISDKGDQSPIAKQVQGDLSFVGIKAIEPITYDSQWVYDIGVPGFENFVGGDSPLILHNSLDEHDEMGITTIPTLTQTDKGVVIQDQGRGLGAESLLFRETKGQMDLRGRFGEGLKLACLPAVRLGYTPRIESPNATIEAWASPTTFGKVEANLLTFIFKEVEGSKRTGTKITIEGYTGDTFKDRFVQFLKPPIFQTPKRVGRFSRFESIYTSPKGRLYVGDIYVRDLADTDYSYNVWGLDLNPDRISEISNESLKGQVAEVWRQVNSSELATRIMKAMTTEDRFENNLSWGYLPKDDLIGYWRAAWVGLFGSRAVLYTNERLSKLAEGYGYKKTGEDWSYGSRRYLGYFVPTDKSIVDERSKELTAPKPIPDSDLTPDQRTNLKLVRYLTEVCPTCVYDGNKPKIVAAVIPPDLRTGDIMLGLCSAGEGNIYLAGSILQTEEDTISTFYHEMGHWVGGQAADDGTMAHTKAVQNVGSAMFLIQQMHSREINDILGIAPTPPPPPRETPVTIKETIGFPNVRYTVVDMDRLYSTDELKALARERGLSTSGSKKEIASQLLSSGFRPSGEAPGEKMYPRIGYTPIPGVTFGIGGQ